jgi:hypothetical protein
MTPTRREIEHNIHSLWRLRFNASADENVKLFIYRGVCCCLELRNKHSGECHGTESPERSYTEGHNITSSHKIQNRRSRSTRKRTRKKKAKAKTRRAEQEGIRTYRNLIADLTSSSSTFALPEALHLHLHITS